MWLATMVSIEHLAACCSRTFLKLYGHREEREFKLFAWHAREELEHKSLAMDLWTSLGHDRKTLRTALIANQKFIWSFVLLYVYKKWDAEFNDDNAADSYALARLVSGSHNTAYEKEVYDKLQDPKFRER